MMIIRKTLFLFLLPGGASAFVGGNRRSSDSPQQRRRRHSNATPLRLIPLAEFGESISFFSEPDEYRCCVDEKGVFSGDDTGMKAGESSSSSPTVAYELGLIEEEELPDLCRFVVETFGAEAIQLSSDINSFERMLMSPAAEFLNGYSGMVAFAEVYSGTRQRVADRLASTTSTTTARGSLADQATTRTTAATAVGAGNSIAVPDLRNLSYDDRIRKAERESLVLILARSPPPESRSSKTIEIIASIELRLQPCDAKIPFSIPWLDRVERKLGTLVGLGSDSDAAGSGGNSSNNSNNSNKNTHRRDNLQPYLSNLCVDERFRGRKIGRGLVRCVENIAASNWGYNRMYLHVDEDNAAALNLYKSEGYRDVGHRWNPFWSGGASEIGYYVKSLKSSKMQ